MLSRRKAHMHRSRASESGGGIVTPGSAADAARLPDAAPYDSRYGRRVENSRKSVRDLRGFCFYSPREKRPAYV
jgi:hypothetical protein